MKNLILSFIIILLFQINIIKTLENNNISLKENTISLKNYNLKNEKILNNTNSNFTLCPFTLSNLTNITILASTMITTANPSIINNGNVAVTP